MKSTFGGSVQLSVFDRSQEDCDQFQRAEKLSNHSRRKIVKAIVIVFASAFLLLFCGGCMPIPEPEPSLPEKAWSSPAFCKIKNFVYEGQNVASVEIEALEGEERVRINPSLRGIYVFKAEKFLGRRLPAAVTYPGSTQSLEVVEAWLVKGGKKIHYDFCAF